MSPTGTRRARPVKSSGMRAVSVATARYHLHRTASGPSEQPRKCQLENGVAFRFSEFDQRLNDRQVFFGENFGSPTIRRATSVRQFLAFAVLSGQQPAR